MKRPPHGAALEELIAGLSDPAAYPHPVQSVQALQTHISCVFLAGDYAYKIKKPVDFGFLDYRTLGQRKACCEEEIRLNRRLCPDMYAGPLPIVQDEAGLHVGGAGEPIEWAVQMRRLRSEEMLSSRLERGDVGRDEMRRSARALAAFHASAPTSAEIRTWGARDVISKTIRTTLRSMSKLTQEILSPDARSGIRRYLRAFLNTEQDLLQRRVGEDCIRDCHGDLRAQNICLDPRYSGGIQIFDCIEFNHEFRYIDVAADIAYLAMDLDLAGRADLRDVLIEEYLHGRRDPDLLRILPFYQVYRACVRGNIALFAANEHEVPESDRGAHLEIAAAAYDLARCYAGGSAEPALLITVGFSGSGKSALARELSRRLPAIVFSTDQVRRELQGSPATERDREDQYTPARRAEVYRELYHRAAPYLSSGHSVVLDGTFLSPHERENASTEAQKAGAQFWILECRCPDSVIRQRLALRRTQSSLSDAGIGVYETQRAAYVPLSLPVAPDFPGDHHLIVDTEQPASRAAHDVVDTFTAAGNAVSSE